MSKCELFKNEIEHLGHLVSGQKISPMRQKIIAIMNLAPATNITEASHMVGLIRYYGRFFPVFSDMITPLNELTKENIPFKWMEPCQKSLDYINQVITTNPFLVYADPDKQYYFFTDNSIHSWEWHPCTVYRTGKEDDTKLMVPNPITYQSGIF